MKNKIVIANMMRDKNKQSFFALHQIYNKIKNFDSNIDVEFHILWDNKIENDDTDPKWKFLIENSNFNVTNYTRDFFNNYCKFTYGISNDIICGFSKFTGIYFVLMSHYLRRVKLYDTYLIYDDDIIIQYDFKNVIEALLNDQAVFITEPMNINCDKVMYSKLIELYGEDFLNLNNKKNPAQLGFNAGFQGIDLSMYDDFLSTNYFKIMIDLFSYKGIYDSNNNEIWGAERFLFDTQQQSFFSLMNMAKCRKKPLILPPDEFFVMPNWGTHPTFGEIDTNDKNDGWTYAMKSKIVHFIGHTRGKGKPKFFLNYIDNYLSEKNI
jgi:hypothetical protein